MSVFVIQTPKPGPKGYSYDISPALEFGQPIYVFEADEQPGLTPVPSTLKARRVLENFNDRDYILWAGGDPFAFAIVVAVAMEINNGKLHFLRWERKRGEDGQRTGRGYYMAVRLSTRLKAE